MSLLTAEEVTNLYLYGNKAKPANIENENLIRKNPLDAPITTSVDINEYMTTGLGRFASPAFFEARRLGCIFSQPNTITRKCWVGTTSTRPTLLYGKGGWL